MTPEVASTVMQFMKRVNLSGAEVDAYNTCMAELYKIVEPAIRELEMQKQADLEAEASRMEPEHLDPEMETEEAA